MKKQLLILLISTLFGMSALAQIQQNDTTICMGDSILLTAESTINLNSFPYFKVTGNEIYVSNNGNNQNGNGSFLNPYLTIQHAINVATNGAIITITDGVYSGIGNTNLNLLGKQIIVQSENGPCCTVIDGNGVNRAFLINQGETSSNTIIRGIHIFRTAATAAPLNYGGGIFVEDNSGIGIQFCTFSENINGCIQFGDTETSGPSSYIENSIFTGNTSYCISSSKKSFYVESCVFENNIYPTGELCGNGHNAPPAQQYNNCLFKCNVAQILVTLGHTKSMNNSLFINNTTSLGCIYMGTTWSGPNMVNHCTFYNNSSVYFTTGTFDHIGNVSNSIFYPGDARTYVSGNQNSINFYNSLGGNITGNGNIAGNPLFVDAFNNNFNLQIGSPCIGSGQNGSNMGIDMSQIPNWFFTNQFSSQNQFLWSNGSTNDSIWITPLLTQYINLNYENCGISQSDSILVTVSSFTPSAGADQSICSGDPVTLNGSGGSTYQWNNNVVDGQAFTPNQSANYVLNGTDSLGCQGTDTVVVTVLENAVSTLTQTALDSYTLNGQTYTQSGTYTQTVPAANGCDSTITLTLTLNFTGMEELGAGPKKLIKITDLNGKIIPRRKNTLMLFIYEDGTVERVVEMEE
jgi:hypothetical protein